MRAMGRAVLVIALGAAVALAVRMGHGGARSQQVPGPHVALGSTTRADLRRTIDTARAAVRKDPGDGEAAVRLANALLRSARVESDASLAIEAERVLQATLQHSPGDYTARRMLAAVYLSQHRFAEALRIAESAMAMRPDDAWNYAVAGDALLELGRYDAAFDAFDRVMARRPDAGAYARVAYARELQGDLPGAVRIMRMAAESTDPADVEARAWTYAQLGNLSLLQSQPDVAEREFNRADFTFPEHPYAVIGRIRLLIARRDYQGALHLADRTAETPELLALRGDLSARLGDAEAAERAYREAERMERDGWQYEQPQPAALARFLAERGRDIPAAVSLAEDAIGERRDIHTLDALAWAYFRAGRLEEASVAIRSATRLGTVDPRIQCHARAIAAARGGMPADGDRICHPLDVSAALADRLQ